MMDLRAFAYKFCIKQQKHVASLLPLGERELHEFLHIAVENIAIHKALDARNLAAVGMLPKSPLSTIGKFLHIVVGYPIGIGIELRGVEVLHLELIASIEDGLDSILGLSHIEPYLDISTQLIRT